MFMTETGAKFSFLVVSFLCGYSGDAPFFFFFLGLPWWLRWKRIKEFTPQFNTWVGKIPGEGVG